MNAILFDLDGTREELESAGAHAFCERPGSLPENLAGVSAFEGGAA